MTTTPTPLRNPAVQETLMTAARLLIAQRTPISQATANLLASTADDVETAGAYLRTGWTGTDMEQQFVFDDGGHRIDWTLAYELAQTVIEELS